MNLLDSPRGRRLLFASLYFAEGAPIGFIWWYLPTQLRLAGLPLERITGLTALLVVPWTLKFLWAPMLDAFRRRGASYRNWALGAQALMAVALAPLPFMDPSRQFSWLVPFLLIHSLAAATQDVAVDGLAITSTPPDQRGGLNGWMQAGMLLGRSLFGGAALILAARLSPGVVPWCLLLSILGTSALLWLAHEPRVSGETGAPDLLFSLRRAARRPATWLGLAFALVSGAGFEAVGAVAGPFLVDRGETREAIGQFLAVPAIMAMMGGALAGGWLSDRMGRLRAVTTGLIGLAAAIFALAALPHDGAGAIPPVLTVVYLGIGVFTASSYALFMDLTDPRLGATQFSTFMAATNGCEAWSALAVGRLATRWGYSPAFMVLGLASLLALPLLRPLGRARRDELYGRGA